MIIGPKRQILIGQKERISGGNILSNPFDLSAASWDNVIAVTVAPNVTVSPNGDMLADKIIPTGTGSAQHQISDTVVAVTNAPHTFVTRLKAGGYNFVEILIADSTGYTKFVGLTFDLSNGSFVSSRNTTYTASHSITSIGNGWYRIAVTVTTDSNGTHRFDVKSCATSNPIGSYNGDTVSGTFGWGFEVFRA